MTAFLACIYGMALCIAFRPAAKQGGPMKDDLQGQPGQGLSLGQSHLTVVAFGPYALGYLYHFAH